MSRLDPARCDRRAREFGSPAIAAMRRTDMYVRVALGSG
jgi:hypothetical protein